MKSSIIMLPATALYISVIVYCYALNASRFGIANSAGSVNIINYTDQTIHVWYAPPGVNCTDSFSASCRPIRLEKQKALTIDLQEKVINGENTTGIIRVSAKHKKTHIHDPQSEATYHVKELFNDLFIENETANAGLKAKELYQKRAIAR